jgi:hypothetical protein
MATRQLTNRRIATVLGAGSTRVEAGELVPGTPVTPAQHSKPARVPAALANIFTPAMHMTE